MALTWPRVLGHWKLAELDLHQVFGVDVESGVLASRSARWLRDRLLDLTLTRGTRLERSLRPDKSTEPEEA
ncbi:hypothetical protein SAMN05444157_1627 [Frankineae bacterium MT45]|nr:hypothetical protein SAMN05444157_1627 [Frankineae bacterium MT45]